MRHAGDQSSKIIPHEDERIDIGEIVFVYLGDVRPTQHVLLECRRAVKAGLAAVSFSNDDPSISHFLLLEGGTGLTSHHGENVGGETRREHVAF